MRTLLMVCIALAPLTALGDAPVDYLRDVKPLLQQRCYACHGALKQEAELRLDTAALMRTGSYNGPVIEPGDADGSPMISRISAVDEDERMPPEGEPLTAAQIASIRRWIEAGAHGPADEEPEKDPREHWAFQKPVRPVVPAVADETSVVNLIDNFLARDHARHKLAPQPAAPKHVLLRRVYLDLIGLPPTREELHAFGADASPRAYEKVVDRLLADPRHGERWGRHWMDVWRYSDWYGRRNQNDVRNSAGQIWRWRDWIVRSLNDDLGYDRMVQQMLAADEVCPEDDDATLATGYLIRNYYSMNPNDWMRNNVEHTSKAFLGLTFNCAHCHDHKYDPITQKDYFRLRAFFEPIYIRQDRVPGEADPGPFEDYVYGGSRKVQRLGAVRIFDKRFDAPTWFYTGGDERNRVEKLGSIAPGVPAFLSTPLPKIEPVKLPLNAWYPALRPVFRQSLPTDGQKALADAEARLAAAERASATMAQAASDRVASAEAALAAVAREAEKAGKPGALSGRQSLLLDASAGRRLLNNKLSQLEQFDDGCSLHFELLLLADAHFNFQFAKDVEKGLTAGFVALENGRIIAYQPKSTTEFEAGRYNFAAGQRRFMVNLVPETAADRCLLTIHSLTDGKTLIEAVPVALNGWNPAKDQLNAITFDARTGSVVLIDDVVIAAPRSTKIADDGAPRRLIAFDFEPPNYKAEQDVVGIEGWTASPLGTGPATSVVSATAASASLREAWQKLQEARRAASAPMLRVQEAEAHLVATAATYALEGPTYPRTSTGRRRALAAWITSRDNPLTARVAVNHMWMRHFRAPLVASVFDFGRSGASPTHPELLDWLAVELMESGWSMKHLHRLIVTSAAYCRACTSKGAEEWVAIDPENKLLWRMNSGRMEAEVLRDSLLYCGGKLDATMGGQELENDQSLSTYRRSLYYSVHPEDGGTSPLGELFDGPDALECYRRSRTILPQQALALTNSALVHEISAAIVGHWEKAHVENFATDSDRQEEAKRFVVAVFERILSRTPTKAELELSLQALDAQRELAKADAAAATRARESLVRALFNHNDFVTVR